MAVSYGLKGFEKRGFSMNVSATGIAIRTNHVFPPRHRAAHKIGGRRFHADGPRQSALGKTGPATSVELHPLRYGHRVYRVGPLSQRIPRENEPQRHSHLRTHVWVVLPFERFSLEGPGTCPVPGSQSPWEPWSGCHELGGGQGSPVHIKALSCDETGRLRTQEQDCPYYVLGFG